MLIKKLSFFRRTPPIFCDKAFYYTSPEVFGKRMKSVTEPAKGLDIPAKHQPPILDIKAMLKVMRGVKSNPPQNIDDIIDGKKMIGNQDHDDFFKDFNKVLGFDGDFLVQDKKLKKTQE